MATISKSQNPRPGKALDPIDWTQRILYGSEGRRLIAVAEARSSKRAEALPGMLMAAIGGGEVAFEARDAALAIISANPGHRDILALAPELAKRFPDPRALWAFSAIAEANPASEECRKAVPALEKVLHDLRGGDDEPLREAVFALGVLGRSSSAEAVKRLVLSGRAKEGSDLWNTAMGALRKLEPQ
jgi:hypothetical protein